MAYSLDFRAAAVGHYKKSKDSLETTAKIFGIAKETLRLWVKKENKTGDLRPRRSTGRPKRLNQEQESHLRSLVTSHPDWTQQRFTQQLHSDFPRLRLPRSTLSLALRRLGFSLKKKRGEPPNNSSHAFNA